MTNKSGTLAVVSFVYPEVKGCIKDFFASIAAQTEKGFSLWIYDDGCGLSRSDLWFSPRSRLIKVSGMSPIEIRYKALQDLSSEFEWVIFIDSDDLMRSNRVEAILAGIELHNDAGVVQHALSVFDSNGLFLDGFARVDIAENLSRVGALNLHFNIYGMSNVAYHARILRGMPELPEIIAFDWLLASYAQLNGEKFVHLNDDLTFYRMHVTNVSRFIKPFDMGHIISSLHPVRAHMTALSRLAVSFESSTLTAEIAARTREINDFERNLTASPEIGETYLTELNGGGPVPGWWWHVANNWAMDKTKAEVA